MIKSALRGSQLFHQLSKDLQSIRTDTSSHKGVLIGGSRGVYDPLTLDGTSHTTPSSATPVFLGFPWFFGGPVPGVQDPRVEKCPVGWGEQMLLFLADGSQALGRINETLGSKLESS